MTLGVTVSQQSMNERIREFRSDPEKMDVTTKFVNEVVEKAKGEALKRMKERDRERSRDKDGDGDGEMRKVPETNYEVGGSRKRARWHSRARGFFSRLFASFCFCNTETQV